MINDEINNQSFSVAARIAELSLNELKKVIEQLSTDIKNGKYNPDNLIKPFIDGEPKRGQMTLKELSKRNDGLSTVELTDPNLRLLSREMKKHNVDFAAVKDGKGKYTLFFKGKDVDSVAHALKRYTQKMVKHEKAKPSIGNELAEAKAAAKVLNVKLDKVKDRSKGALGR